MDRSFKSPRPLPIFLNDVAFSHKKTKRATSDGECLPPRPPVKSAPPVSRLFKHSRKHNDGAHEVSFQGGGSKIKSPHYNDKLNKLYFEQCFEVICELGAGSFGEVFKVKSKEDGNYYAVKKSCDRFRGDADRKNKLEEVNKHEQLKMHPNCVHFIKAWEERDHLYIQTELCSSSLKDYLEKNNAVSEREVWNFLLDLTLGLKHLHDHGMVHMDIKPANVFFGRDGLCKIGDFGLVLELSKCDVSDALEGDPMYLAPELMQGSFTKAADIFSLGITLLEAACDLDLPRGGDSWHQLRNGQLPHEFAQGLSPELVSLITSMMCPIPARRPTVDDILRLPAVQQTWKRRRWRHYYSRMSSTLSQVYTSICSLFVWIFLLVIWPFKPVKDLWLSARAEVPADPNLSYSTDNSFSHEDSHNSSVESWGTPDRSNSSFEKLLSQPVPKPPFHRTGYCSSPANHTPCARVTFSRLSPTPDSHLLNARLTPPLDTSSPSRGQYTPPSEGRRGRLFEDDGITAKIGVGPKNLLDVFDDAGA